MSGVFDEIELRFSGEDSNAKPYLGEGWHGAELSHRWMDGLRSVLRLPALRTQDWFVLTLEGWALDLGGVDQPLTVALNGTSLQRVRLGGGAPLAIAIPGDLVRADAENIVVFDHPGAARPCDHQPGNPDGRRLSLALQAVALAPLDAPLHLAPRLLPEVEPPERPDEAKDVMERFQSLGQNCGLGGVQRHYGAEPFGLLRFASVHPRQLVEGLRTRFKGVGDLSRLSFRPFSQSRELQGHHAD